MATVVIAVMPAAEPALKNKIIIKRMKSILDFSAPNYYSMGIFELAQAPNPSISILLNITSCLA